jgi:hypothetical protein
MIGVMRQLAVALRHEDAYRRAHDYDSCDRQRHAPERGKPRGCLGWAPRGFFPRSGTYYRIDCIGRLILRHNAVTLAQLRCLGQGLLQVAIVGSGAHR